MRWVVMLIVGMSAHSAQAKWAVSADTGAALVMPTGLEGQTETVGPNLGVNLGYHRAILCALTWALCSGSRAPADIRPGGFQAIRPAVAFVFGGGIYGKASIPLTLSGQSNLGLLVGGGHGSSCSVFWAVLSRRTQAMRAPQAGSCPWRCAPA